MTRRAGILPLQYGSDLGSRQCDSIPAVWINVCCLYKQVSHSRHTRSGTWPLVPGQPDGTDNVQVARAPWAAASSGPIQSHSCVMMKWTFLLPSEPTHVPSGTRNHNGHAMSRLPGGVVDKAEHILPASREVGRTGSIQLRESRFPWAIRLVLCLIIQSFSHVHGPWPLPPGILPEADAGSQVKRPVNLVIARADAKI